MKAIAIAHRMGKASDLELRNRVLAPNPAHILATTNRGHRDYSSVRLISHFSKLISRPESICEITRSTEVASLELPVVSGA